MMQVLESVLVDLTAMAKTARNPAAKKMLQKRMQEILEALIKARP
jgi:hypothetical protein